MPREPSTSSCPSAATHLPTTSAPPIQELGPWKGSRGINGPDSQPVPCRWREGPWVWPSSVSLLLCGSLSSWGLSCDGCYSELRWWERRDIAESLGLCTGRGRWSMRSRGSQELCEVGPLVISVLQMRKLRHREVKGPKPMVGN